MFRISSKLKKLYILKFIFNKKESKERFLLLRVNSKHRKVNGSSSRDLAEDVNKYNLGQAYLIKLATMTQ